MCCSMRIKIHSLRGNIIQHSVVTGALFLFIVNLMGFFKHQFWIVIVPIVALITFMNIRGAKFCDNCGKSNFTQSLKDKKIECQKCGHTI